MRGRRCPCEDHRFRLLLKLANQPSYRHSRIATAVYERPNAELGDCIVVPKKFRVRKWIACIERNKSDLRPLPQFFHDLEGSRIARIAIRRKKMVRHHIKMPRALRKNCDILPRAGGVSVLCEKQALPVPAICSVSCVVVLLWAGV